jgi:hypothetical protein
LELKGANDATEYALAVARSPVFTGTRFDVLLHGKEEAGQTVKIATVISHMKGHNHVKAAEGRANTFDEAVKKAHEKFCTDYVSFTYGSIEPVREVLFEK